MASSKSPHCGQMNWLKFLQEAPGQGPEFDALPLIPLQEIGIDRLRRGIEVLLGDGSHHLSV
jgi:hypothetical protein